MLLEFIYLNNENTVSRLFSRDISLLINNLRFICLYNYVLVVLNCSNKDLHSNSIREAIFNDIHRHR